MARSPRARFWTGTTAVPTWGEIKAHAGEMLGIDLTDFHVGNLPPLATNPYGNFIPDLSTGFPQVVMFADPDDPDGGPSSPPVPPHRR